MKNFIEKIGVLCAGGGFLAVCLVLFCIDSIYEYFYKTFLPKKWKLRQKMINEKIAKQEEKNLSRGWAYQPNIFGEH